MLEFQQRTEYEKKLVQSKHNWLVNNEGEVHPYNVKLHALLYYRRCLKAFRKVEAAMEGPPPMARKLCKGTAG